ncbi:MAG: non-hydrolyzing UDP-N-acetylglucosamine 2-epimerase [Promethearchaeota archaeon]
MDAIIIGTRPEIIKCSPLIKEYISAGNDFLLIHTNQHYSFEMDEIFFEELELRKPDFNLNVGSGSHAVQTGKIMMGIEEILERSNVDRILVQGDTNTVLGSALAASKMDVKIGHVEAGLRSFDRSMPEEINRVLTDHISDYLFCPTNVSRQNLLNEGIADNKIHVVGNTIVDATLQNFEIAKKKAEHILDSFNVKRGDYNLLTAHRPANVDFKDRLHQIIAICKLIIEETGSPIIFPAHPRTKKNFEKFNLLKHIPSDLMIVDPVGYLEFLMLEKYAAYIFTDSGGIQEEACILRVPCITLRENTERPETVSVGSNVLAGFDKKKIRDAIYHFKNRVLDYEIPFGRGNTSQLIFKILNENN